MEMMERGRKGRGKDGAVEARCYTHGGGEEAAGLLKFERPRIDSVPSRIRPERRRALPRKPYLLMSASNILEVELWTLRA